MYKYKLTDGIVAGTTKIKGFALSRGMLSLRGGNAVAWQRGHLSVRGLETRPQPELQTPLAGVPGLALRRGTSA